MYAITTVKYSRLHFKTSKILEFNFTAYSRPELKDNIEKLRKEFGMESEFIYKHPQYNYDNEKWTKSPDCNIIFEQPEFLQ